MSQFQQLADQKPKCPDLDTLETVVPRRTQKTGGPEVAQDSASC